MTEPLSGPEIALAERLNQAARRLRLAESVGEWTAILTEIAGRFAAKVSVFLAAECRQAPAFATVFESLDTVVTLRDANQLGATVYAALGESNATRCYLFPILKSAEVVAVLVADGQDAPNRSGLELVAALAGGTLPDAPPLEPAVAPALIQIAVAKPGNREKSKAAPAGVPVQHLKAQRFASVSVARLLLDHREAIEHGRRNRAIYVYLKHPIQVGRREFQTLFLESSPTMSDYYHEELVRTLAKNDPSLLGVQYPGPLQPDSHR
ncbi:MAG: hypothetical protein HYZ37_16630 [Candidatus Solibacter usitatus]|nr:hypothetical protein [Candidatus Solibacter usitatus]